MASVSPLSKLSASSSWCSTEGWGPIADDQASFTSCFQNTVLFGASAVFASIVFLVRSRQLQKHGRAHSLGRVNILFWPSQIALSVAVLVLLGRLFSVGISDLSSSGVFAIIFLAVAWVLAIRLSSLETIYSIRSSSPVLIFELLSILFSLPRLISLYSLEDPTPSNIAELTFQSRYLCAIGVSFVFEAWPRGRTSVQQQSHATRNDKANIFSQWTFYFMQPIISRGYRQPLKMEDIQNVMPANLNTLEGPYQELSIQWAQNVRDAEAANRLQAMLISSNKKTAGAKSEPNLLWTIMKTFWRPMTALVAYQIADSLVRFMPPVLLRQILIYLGSPSDSDEHTRNWGIMLAVAMLAVNVLASILMGLHYALNLETGIEVRTALISMIYRKALVLSPEARKGSSSGEITNHMSSDAEKWASNLIWLPMWISIPIEITIGTYMLYNLLGWSAFCGLAMIVIITPIQGWAGNFIDSSRAGKMEAQDSRVRLMTEILANIKIVKLYSYTEAFLQKVLAFRNKEVEMLRRTGTTDSFMTFIFSCMSLLMAFVNLAVYATVGGPGFTPGDINAQTIFVSITLLGLLSHPIGTMSMVVEGSIGIRVSMRRVQGFLLKEEMDSSAVLRIDDLPRDTRSPVIQISNATLAWGSSPVSAEQASMSFTEETEATALLSGNSKKATDPTLYDINTSIARSSLTAVVGRVGQGKSSLLSAMIGDMYKRQGTIKIFGSVAYIPQQAWIINATLRDNIVFQKPFNQEKYDRIVHACGLLPDIEILPARDMTEIGERGINLSGGQKQRVSLARAAYQDADIYLFDDPLSAVDAHVDQHLWNYLIGPNGLLSRKTRVIVTHGIHHLEQCDHILVIKDGRIAEAGRYDSLMKAKKAFHQLINEYSIAHKVSKAASKAKKAAAKTSKKTTGQDAAVEAAVTKTKIASTSASASTSVSATTSDDEDETGTLIAAEDSNTKTEAGGELIEEEVIRGSLVQWKTFSYYCKAMSYYYLTMTIFLFAVWELLQLSVPVWLEHWISVSNTTDKSITYFLVVYAFLVFAYLLIDVYLTYTTKVTACMQASVALHNSALERMMVLPMSFFDSTPQGRILNRFSSDIECIDESIPYSLMQTVICSFNLIGHLLIISFATPIFMISIPPLALLFMAIQRYYSSTSSVIKRLESTTRSPIYQHFSESLNGATCIRAMGLQTRFIADNANRVDKFSNAYYTWSMINRWMNFRLESLATFVVFSSTLMAVLNKGSLTPSLAGLALSFTLGLVDHVTWYVKVITMFQGQMVSVERVHEYSVKNSEAPLVTGVHVPENWPSHGHIVFKNFSARYREGLGLVLKNVSFEVQPAEKVGIVGRTGAGKSSLTLALFRIIEAADSYWARASEQDGAAKELRHALQLQQDLSEISSSGDGGSIEIDGLDISTLGLRDLRKSLAIIPQDPTLFAGTVRENLDPFNELEDSELWTALERAHLKDHITSLAGGLSFEVSQNGENFSVGQRSLICLARALLRKTKILIMDEATAAVDVETDELIQATIRKEFKDRTILTIAHRIKTVMDSDKILVLEKGQVEEYDEPKKLLRKKESLFYRLAEQAGEI